MKVEARRDALLVAAVALVARSAMVLWAAPRIPPIADGFYYDELAKRLSQGLGYTWAWPDGAVTYAAHYPVGYPAMLAAIYRLAGPSPAAAMWLNALVGVLGVVAAHALASRAMPRRAALAGGMIAALEPALVAYTPALMTEGVTASLVCVAAWRTAVAAEERGRRRWLSLALLSGVLGLATLVRPQSLVLAPLLGFVACSPTEPLARRARDAALVTAGALLAVLPWTARNCARMGKCALVSVNGGWNLLIGADPSATGHWSPVDVPPACKTVFDEAAKDTCFGDAAEAMILADPIRWIRLVPAKLSATFDYAGAAPWYLHDANREAFPWSSKVALGGLETVFHRLVVIAALAALGISPGPRPRLRRTIAVLGALAAAWAAAGHGHRGGDVAHLALVAVVACFGRALFRLPILALSAAIVVVTTAVVHAAFFGAGRYGLVVFPLVGALSGALLTGLSPRGDTSRHAAD